MLLFQGAYLAIFWLIVLIVLLVIEAITVGLTSIWGVGGAFAAIFLAELHTPFWLQVIVFLFVTGVLLIFTRPFALKYINVKREKTNYEGVIGKKVCIVQRVDNLSQTGMAIVNGQEWTVRAKEDGKVIETGKLVKVVDIQGVKLIVREEEEE